jgi:long-chain fatty acid transport protein
LLAAQTARGQGVVRDSIGATSSGRGGANIAHSDNLTLVLDNPAGLANLPQRARFDFGADLLFTRLDYADPFDKTHAEPVPFALPQFAYSRRTADDHLTYGIGVFAPAGFGAHYQLHHALYGQREYSSFGALLKILPAVAYRVDERLSVGATFGLAISHAQFDMPYHLQSGLLAGIPALVNMKATGVAPTWSVGAQYQIDEQTTVGLAYISETRFRLKGDAHMDVSGLGLPLLKAAYDAEVDLVWPASLGAGITHQLNERHRVSADVLWFDWSHAFDRLDMKLTDGSNPLFNFLLGPQVRDRLPLDWHDSIAVRLGYEYFPTPDDVIRLGYVYHKSPIPSDTLMPNLGGTLEHALTFGYGHQWKKWRIDLAYQYSWAPANHVSSSRLLGGDYDHSTFEAQAHWVFLTLSYSF